MFLPPASAPPNLTSACRAASRPGRDRSASPPESAPPSPTSARPTAAPGRNHSASLPHSAPPSPTPACRAASRTRIAPPHHRHRHRLTSACAGGHHGPHSVPHRRRSPRPSPPAGIPPSATNPRPPGASPIRSAARLGTPVSQPLNSDPTRAPPPPQPLRTQSRPDASSHPGRHIGQSESASLALARYANWFHSARHRHYRKAPQTPSVNHQRNDLSSPHIRHHSPQGRLLPTAPSGTRHRPFSRSSLCAQTSAQAPPLAEPPVLCLPPHRPTPLLSPARNTPGSPIDTHRQHRHTRPGSPPAHHQEAASAHPQHHHRSPRRASQKPSPTRQRTASAGLYPARFPHKAPEPRPHPGSSASRTQLRPARPACLVWRSPTPNTGNTGYPEPPAPLAATA